jgi:hypothetical protein
MDPLYKEIWNYIAESSSAAQSVMIAISAGVVATGYYIVNKCSKLNSLRKSRKSGLESEVKEN